MNKQKQNQQIYLCKGLVNLFNMALEHKYYTV